MKPPGGRRRPPISLLPCRLRPHSNKTKALCSLYPPGRPQLHGVACGTRGDNVVVQENKRKRFLFCSSLTGPLDLSRFWRLLLVNNSHIGLLEHLSPFPTLFLCHCWYRHSFLHGCWIWQVSPCDRTKKPPPLFFFWSWAARVQESQEAAADLLRFPWQSHDSMMRIMDCNVAPPPPPSNKTLLMKLVERNDEGGGGGALQLDVAPECYWKGRADESDLSSALIPWQSCWRTLLSWHCNQPQVLHQCLKMLLLCLSKSVWPMTRLKHLWHF